VTDEQDEKLQYLYGSLIEKIPLTAPDARASRVEEWIGPWKLSLMVMPHDSGEGWKYVDPFVLENRGLFKLYSTDEEGNVVDVEATVYDTLQREDLPQTLNLNLGAIAEAYEAIRDVASVTHLANRCVLRLVHAADDSELRRGEFLEAASRLNDWLVEREGPSVPNTLNHLQISARQRGGLSEEQRSTVRQLRRELVRAQTDGADMNEAGCAILLGEKEELEDCLSRLTEALREELAGYPIWTLAIRQGLLASAVGSAIIHSKSTET
jgi:hypothetical protein